MCHHTSPNQPAKEKQSPEDLLKRKTQNTTDKTPLPNYATQGIDSYEVPPDDELVEE